MTLDARSRERLREDAAHIVDDDQDIYSRVVPNLALIEQQLRQTHIEINRLTQAAQAALHRQMILSSTWECGKVSGSNKYVPEESKLPWMGFHRDGCTYLDTPSDLAKAIYLIAIARGHLKSEIGVHKMVSHVCNHPETRNGIVGGTGMRADANLSNIHQILQSDEFQAALPDVLYPAGSREAYQSSSLLLRRKGKYREPTVIACGIGDNTTGMHIGMNAMCWIDDIVTKQNYRDKPEERKKIREAMIHFISFICDPGARILFTFTRWGLDDAYSVFFEENSAWERYIVPNPPILGCYEVGENGALRPLYPLKYCMEADEYNNPVAYEGELYHVPRESLVEKERTMEPWEWNSQMLNDPQPDSVKLFHEEYFDTLLPCTGQNLPTFLDDPASVKEFIRPPENPLDRIKNQWLDRGQLIAALSGDCSYEDKAHNDYQVLLLILQDRFNNWYVCDGYYARKGYKGLEEYIGKAVHFRDNYNVFNPVGIEHHGKEAIKTVANMYTRQTRRTDLTFAKLTANSNKSKEARVGRLEPQFRNRKVYWCANMDWLRRLAKEEMCAFGAGAKHDDIGDTFANFMDEEVLPVRTGAVRIGPVYTTAAARTYYGQAS